MAQSIRYRILSAVLLLVIVCPVFPGLSSAGPLPRAEAAETGPAMAAPAAVAALDFTVPRPTEGQDHVQAAGTGTAIVAAQENTGVPVPPKQRERDLLAYPPMAPLQSSEEITLVDLPTPFIYVADNSEDAGGVWRSLDLGETWMHFTTGLEFPDEVRMVEVSRSDPSILYLATLSGGTQPIIYKSTDYGETWNGADNGLPREYPAESGEYVVCLGLAIHPWNPEIVAALVSNWDGDGYSRIYRTVDGGSTWEETTDWFQSDLYVPSTGVANLLAQDAMAPQHLLAALLWTCSADPYRYQYLRSTDTGESWSWQNAPSQTEYLDERAVVYDFDMNGGVALLANLEADDAAVYTSTNYSDTWTASLDVSGTDWNSVKIDPFDSNIYYARHMGGVHIDLWRTENRGITWTQVYTGNWAGNVDRLLLAFSIEGLLMTVDQGQGGLHLSLDRGDTFLTQTYTTTGAAIDAAFGENLLSAAMCNGGTCDCEFNPGCCAARYKVGKPIDTFSGNHSYQVQDLSVPVVGGALSFERTYASQNVTTTVLGYGWTHNYAMRLTPPAIPNGMVTVTSPDGSKLLFFANGDGTYTPYPGVQGALVHGATTYTLTGSAQTAYIFDSGGRLITIRDPQGRETTLSYNSASTPQLTRVSGPDGDRYLDFLYNTQGWLREVSDHTGRHVSFGYVAVGSLAVVTDTRGFTWTYSYTGSHLLYDVRDPLRNLVERTAYDDEGRAIRQWSGDAGSPTLDLEIAFLDEGARVITDARRVSQTAYYDARNTWIGLEDAGGHPITRTYDAHFNLNYVEDANGNPTEIVWGDCGCRPEAITDAQDHTTRMLYDGHNNLVSTTDALNHTTLYDYDLDINLLLSTTDALEHVTYYDYNDAGLLAWTKDPLEHETRYQYDEYGQVLSVAAYSGTTWITITTYAYDDLGRQISAEDVASHVAMTFYDGGGYVTRTVENCTAGSYEDCRTVQYSAVYPDENIVTGYAYDGIGNRVRVTNTLGIVTAYGYDDANRLITVTENYEDGSYSEDAPDEDLITTYEYDAAGNQTFVIDPAGIATRTFYDTLNRPVTMTANFIDWGQYDPRYPDQNVSTSYGYDAAGNQVTVTNPLGMVTLTGYDELNRPAVITQNYTTTTPNPDPATYNLVIRYVYNAVGNQTRVTDPRGVATCYEYDELNRVSAVVENCVDLHGLPGPLNVTTEYEYDAGGNRVAVQNPLDVLTHYDYDDLNRLTQIVENAVEPAGQGPDRNITTRYRYDLRGNRTQVIDPLGMVTRYQYDDLNRLITTTANYIGSGQFDPVYSDRNVVTVQHHDGLGRRTYMFSPLEVVTRYEYDDLGRVVKLWENFTVQPQGTGDENVTTSFYYDPRGNRTALVDPEGYTTTYAYDDLSRLITVADALDQATVYAYDAAGNRTQVIDANENTTANGYDIHGRVVEGAASLGTGLVIATGAADQRYPDVAWDAAGGYAAVWQEGTSSADIHGTILDEVGVTLAGAETLAAVGNAQERPALAYDGDRGRFLVVWTDSRDGGSSPDVYGQLYQGYTVVVNYAYDGLYRLAEAAYSDGAYYGYDYDAVGNRTRYTNTTAPVTVTTYTYDAADRLTAVTRAGVQTSYTWSSRGELLSDGVQAYQWDAAGRLIGVTGPEDLVVSYTYDGAHNRTGMTVDGVATAYVVDPYSPVDSVAQVLEETTGNDTTRNLYGLDLFAQQQDETTTYLAYDALSVRLHLDSDGALFATYRYGPYGEVVGTGPEGYGYTGEQWDRYIKMTYLRARYYQPEMGRFISRDRLPGVLGQPQTLQRFLYVTGNPVNWVDPAGMAHDAGTGGVGGDIHIPSIDPEYKQRIDALKNEILESAGRHFIPSALNKEQFAILLTAIMYTENRDGKQSAAGLQKTFNMLLGPNETDTRCMTGWIFSAFGVPEERLSFYTTLGNHSIGLAALNMRRPITILEQGAELDLGLGSPARQTTEWMQGLRHDLAQTYQLYRDYGGDIRVPLIMGANLVAYMEMENLRNVQIAAELTDDRLAVEYLAADMQRGAMLARRKGVEPTWDILAGFKNTGAVSYEIFQETAHVMGFIEFVGDVWPLAARVITGQYSRPPTTMPQR